MAVNPEFQNQEPLYRIGLSNGIYEPVDPQKIEGVFGSWEVEDNEGLLDKVINPPTMSLLDHGNLLTILIGKGYKHADQEFAVGPILDTDLKPVPNKMRVVRFKSIRERI